MKSAPHRRVANPPQKPLMLFDGNCHFCRRWIERWRELTVGRVDYASSQEAGGQSPEIPPSEFEKSVQFIETDGTVFRGAEAVFRSLRCGGKGKWLAWSYDRIPGFAAITETAYGLVARNRSLASAGTRLLWGDDVRRPNYFAARRGFLKTLGLIYLLAFISVWTQVDGLMGSQGILPAGEMLSSIRDNFGAQPLRLPTICWWDSSDTTLHALCLVGALAAALLSLGLLPVPALMVCFACYLSLTTVGEIFFGFQWDILLLETGFVALFLAPLQWRLHRRGDAPVSRIGLFLAKALLFKLMFMSGVVKLTSGDPSWLDLTALDYHYWTQPLPTVLAWFSDHNPEWAKKFCVAVALFVEIVVPFSIWGPRRLRAGAACLLIALQVGIALTGNYNFFNLLVIALCLLLIDDAMWAPQRARETAGSRLRWPVFVPAAALLVTLPLNAWFTYTAIKPRAEWPKPLVALYSAVEPFRIANGYGLFRVMTKERAEIVIEGSADGRDWIPYEFKWKPGDLKRAPGWIAPHQPRVDWQMWFAALGTYRQNPWFGRFVLQLLKNSPAVTGLLERNPFPDMPPRYIRAVLYDYRFTTWDERRATGAWWKREDRGIYLPRVSLQ